MKKIIFLFISMMVLVLAGKNIPAFAEGTDVNWNFYVNGDRAFESVSSEQLSALDDWPSFNYGGVIVLGYYDNKNYTGEAYDSFNLLYERWLSSPVKVDLNVYVKTAGLVPIPGEYGKWYFHVQNEVIEYTKEEMEHAEGFPEFPLENTYSYYVDEIYQEEAVFGELFDRWFSAHFMSEVHVFVQVYGTLRYWYNDRIYAEFPMDVVFDQDSKFFPPLLEEHKILVGYYDTSSFEREWRTYYEMMDYYEIFWNEDRTQNIDIYVKASSVPYFIGDAVFYKNKNISLNLTDIYKLTSSYFKDDEYEFTIEIENETYSKNETIPGEYKILLKATNANGFSFSQEVIIKVMEKLPIYYYYSKNVYIGNDKALNKADLTAFLKLVGVLPDVSLSVVMNSAYWDDVNQPGDYKITIDYSSPNAISGTEELQLHVAKIKEVEITPGGCSTKQKNIITGVSMVGVIAVLAVLLFFRFKGKKGDK